MGLGHNAVVRRDDQNNDVGGLGAARTHLGERFVARRIEEHDAALFRVHIVRGDVLRNTARFAGRDVRRANPVQEGRLAVVDVAHYRDHRRPRLQILRIVRLFGQHFFLPRDCRRYGNTVLVTQFADRVKVQHMVFRRHDVEIHKVENHVVHRDLNQIGELLDCCTVFYFDGRDGRSSHLNGFGLDRRILFAAAASTFLFRPNRSGQRSRVEPAHGRRRVAALAFFGPLAFGLLLPFARRLAGAAALPRFAGTLRLQPLHALGGLAFNLCDDRRIGLDNGAMGLFAQIRFFRFPLGLRD
jgi:hypothetical protein